MAFLCDDKNVANNSFSTHVENLKFFVVYRWSKPVFLSVPLTKKVENHWSKRKNSHHFKKWENSQFLMSRASDVFATRNRNTSTFLLIGGKTNENKLLLSSQEFL